VQEPVDLWTHNAPASLQGRVPRVKHTEQGDFWLFDENKPPEAVSFTVSAGKSYLDYYPTGGSYATMRPGMWQTQARLADMGSLAQIWASPLVRAQQTAEIAAGYFPQLKIQTTKLLVPEANPQALMDWLDELNAQQLISANQSILLVSHQPLVGSLVNMLCSKPDDYYPMGTSSLAAIRAQVIAADMGDLLWLDHA